MNHPGQKIDFALASALRLLGWQDILDNNHELTEVQKIQTINEPLF